MTTELRNGEQEFNEYIKGLLRRMDTGQVDLSKGYPYEEDDGSITYYDKAEHPVKKSA